jgi:hypothetical protein
MAGLKRSPKSFPRAWLHAGIALLFIAESGILKPVIEAFFWFILQPGATSISILSFIHYFQPST